MVDDSLLDTTRQCLSRILGDSMTASVDEVKDAVDELLTEYCDLRRNLEQNNQCTRRLSDAFVAMHDKCEKAQDVIAKLSQENGRLRIQLGLDEAADRSSIGDFSLAPRALSNPLMPDWPLLQDGSFIFVPDVNGQEEEEERTDVPGQAVYDHVTEPTADGDANNRRLQEEVAVANARWAEAADLAKTEQIHNMDLKKEIVVIKMELLKAKADGESERRVNEVLAMEKAQLVREMDRLLENDGLSAARRPPVGRLIVAAAISVLVACTVVVVVGRRNASESQSAAELEHLKRINSHLSRQWSELNQQFTYVNSSLTQSERVAWTRQLRNSELHKEIVRLEKSLQAMDMIQAQVDACRSERKAERADRHRLSRENGALQQQIEQAKRENFWRMMVVVVSGCLLVMFFKTMK